MDAVLPLNAMSGGLTEEQIRVRRAQFGPNELAERSSRSPLLILREQLTATLVIVLVIAAVVSAALGDWHDALAILAIVILNALLGFQQEYKAERAMAALRRMAVPVVRVRRNGEVQEISARDLVPDDIVLLDAGAAVPADGRLVESANLRIDESALTGESQPVDKDAAVAVPAGTPLAERHDAAFMGTSVTYGRGVMCVTATGMRTELGAIAGMLQTVEREPTPLQRHLDHLGKTLAVVAIVMVAIIFVVGLLRGENPRLMFLTAVSLAVAAVPEGLPAVVTIALALGSQRMLQRNVIIRKLAAVETLGSVTTICSDKTGTLTRNQMAVSVIDVAGRTLELPPEAMLGLSATGETSSLSAAWQAEPTFELTLVAASLCNDAQLRSEDANSSGRLHAVGDPTEGALLEVAGRLGLSKSRIERLLPRVQELPFDSDRKRMTTVHECDEANGEMPRCVSQLMPALTQVASDSVAGEGTTSKDKTPAAGHKLLFAKGAVDSLLDVATQHWVHDHAEPLDDEARGRIMSAHDHWAEQGMRVIGIALRCLAAGTAIDLQHAEEDLIFLGLVAMIDPPRAEAAAAVKTCRQAGIRPVMITGDHPLTARFIAGQLDIGDGGVVTGAALERMAPAELERVAVDMHVYARVTPAHKLQLVGALQRQGQIVAMTGDGVNDAPALKQANIGVAMGITGTDVSKEAADMILRDDNFASIVSAVEEGRVIYDNIRKFVRYLLSANVGEIFVMFLGPILGMPLPLWPLQILWMNLVTDGLPALALGLEPAESDVMQRPPRPPQQRVLSRGVAVDIAWIGMFMGVVALALGYVYWRNGSEVWQTMVFTTLTLSQMTLALAVRSDRQSLFRIGLLSNLPMLAAIASTLLLQLAAIYLPLLQSFLKTRSLTAQDLAICLVASTLIFCVVELRKGLRRRIAKSN